MRQRVCGALVVDPVQTVIDPADQVAFGNVANEQVKTVGNLVQMAVSQPMGRQRATGNVVRLGASVARFLVSAGPWAGARGRTGAKVLVCADAEWANAQRYNVQQLCLIQSPENSPDVIGRG